MYHLSHYKYNRYDNNSNNFANNELNTSRPQNWLSGREIKLRVIRVATALI